MGVDIHAFIEYDVGVGNVPFGVDGDVRLFNKGELFIPRDRELFDMLAGAVSIPIGRVPENMPFPPRGLPLNPSYWLLRRYCVTTTSQTNHSPFNIPVYYVCKSFREAFLLSSVPVDSSEKGELLYINPEWHSTSWLTLDEIKAILAERAGYDIAVEFGIIVRVMEQLEERYGGGRTRLVIWFDN